MVPAFACRHTAGLRPAIGCANTPGVAFVRIPKKKLE